MEEDAKYLEDFYPFLLELETELLCVGLSGQEKSDFTFQIQQDLTAKVCNTALDSLTHQFYLFSSLSGNQPFDLAYSACSGHTVFYHISGLNNTITYSSY